MTKKEIGNLGEDLAIKYLKQKNFLILDKNYIIYGGEIDVVAQDPDTREIVFVEVKTRSSTDYAWPEEAINQKKKQHLNKTAYQYMTDNYANTEWHYRFDAVSIELNFKIRQAKIVHFKAI